MEKESGEACSEEEVRGSMLACQVPKKEKRPLWRKGESFLDQLKVEGGA